MGDKQSGGRPMNWRYQAVWRTEASGDRYYTICEIYLDKFGALTSWTESAEYTPLGNDLGDLLGELTRMYVDAACWEPVAFDSLRIGMIFERAIKEQRAGISDLFAAFAELSKPQTGLVSDRTAPNTDESK